MTLCKAYKTVKEKRMTAWMCYGISKWNDSYCVFETLHMKKFPNQKYIYVRKGEGFPNPPNYVERKIN